MIPVLTHFFALFGLIAIPSLVAIYFFRNRFQKKPVSSLMLWSSIAPPKEGGAVLKKIRVPLIFFLELLALLLILSAAIDPRWPLLRKRRQLVVVLDDSASMSVSAGISSVRERAIAALHKEIRSGRFFSIRFVLAGCKPQILGTTGRTATEIDKMLYGWRCHSSSSLLAPAIALALDLAGKRSAVLVLTDEEPVHIPGDGRVKWLAFGQSEPNTAIIAAARTLGALTDRCFLEIANYSSEPVEAKLVITSSNPQHVGESLVKLGPRSTRKIIFETPTRNPQIHAVLGHDSLLLDNAVRLLSQSTHRVRIKIDMKDPILRKLVTEAVDATGMKAGVNIAPHILFTDGSSVSADYTSTWPVRIVSGSNPSAYIGPYVMNHSHPIAQGLDLEGLVWGAVSTNQLPGVPVISTGNIALITDDSKITGRHDLYIHISPRFSTVQDSPNWPAIIWNIVNWRAERLPGLEYSNVRSGLDVRLSTDRHVANVVLTQPDGRETTLPVRSGVVTAETHKPGLYKLKTDSDEQYQLAANFTYPEESDLESCKSGSWGNWDNADSLQRDYIGIAHFLILLAIAALVTHLLIITHQAKRI